MIDTVRFPVDPQPKYGKPFQIVGDTTGRFYNGNPAYPHRSNTMFSFAWHVPDCLDRSTVRIEKDGDMYVWVGTIRSTAA